jgi:soluble lytic murein transglycosylase-like protein
MRLIASMMVIGLLSAGSAEAGLFGFGRKKPATRVETARAPFRVPSHIQKLIDEAASQFGLDAKLVAAVVSRRGAQGLMQLMPRTAASLGVKNAFDPRENIFGGTKYLKQLHDEFGGDLELTLGAYNAGPFAVKRAGTATPTEEAKHYVAAVLGYYRAL